MLGKKGEDKKPSKEEELIKRVDAMLDPKLPDPAPEESKPTTEPKSQPTPPPLDIFKDTKTAPEIPGKTVKPDAKSTTIEQLAEKKVEKPIEPIAKPNNSVSEEAQIEPIPIDESNPTIENKETDKAVQDIVAKEGDALLAAQDAAINKANNPKPTEKPGFKSKLKKVLKSKITWIIVVLLVIVLFAVPYTRYKILGTFIKKSVTISVVDSKTKSPVSNAEVSVNGEQLKTDAEGQIRTKLGVGPVKLDIKKQYYKTSEKTVFIGVYDTQDPKLDLQATGRQVPITVINRITGQPVSNAHVSVLSTSVKTDKKGKATIVLPAATSREDTVIKAKGYNTANPYVYITDNVIPENTFALTPVGKVYFLSNQTGKIDVVKTNLDGTDRTVVLAGVGKEEAHNTSLLASRDWRYVLLKAKRDSAQPALYLIDTVDDKVDQIEGGTGNIEMIGWYGHYFMYSITNNSISQSQNGKQVVKSYDADKDELKQIDQTQAEGNTSTYGHQVFNNFHILNNILTYTVQWNAYDATGNGFNFAGKNGSIRGVQPNGQNKKDYQTFPAAGVGYIQSAQYGPQSVYYSVYNSDNGKTSYYQFDNNSATAIKNIDQSDLNKTYPTYLVSPAGNRTLWSDVRDGKYTIFLGDSNGKNPKQTPSSTGDYAPYGWYSDDLILVTKDSNQLFVMPIEGLPATKQPLKVANYYRPATTISGYGYGYGGL